MKIEQTIEGRSRIEEGRLRDCRGVAGLCGAAKRGEKVISPEPQLFPTGSHELIQIKEQGICL